MNKVYELIGKSILYGGEVVSKKSRKKVSIEVRILDINRNHFEILYKDDEEVILRQIGEFSNLQEEYEVFIDRLYDAFYKNTRLYLSIQNLQICETNTDSEVLSFDTSKERIDKVNEAYSKTYTFNYKEGN